MTVCARWICAIALACSLGCSQRGDSPAAAAPDVQWTSSTTLTVASLESLNERARERLLEKARVPLEAAPVALRELRGLEYSANGHVPNYVAALGEFPEAARALADLARAVVHEGPLPPEIKLAAGLRAAQINQSAYVAAHLQRLLRASERGQSLLAHIERGDLSSLREPDRVALVYADSLTNDTQAGSDEEFGAVRENYGDDEIVDLTAAVGFFNYLSRFAEALALPVEAWVLDPAEAASAGEEPADEGRVRLLSDDEISVISGAARAVMERPGATSGLALPNSQRAMLRVPAISIAWTRLNTALKRLDKLEPATALQVSFAVSTENGCRYCTMHQVVGLRRLGVSPGKLLALKKDDESLTPRELVAVRFARKLTSAPAGLTDADYDALRAEFGDHGALEVLLETCRFAFMNRFTDGLRLPSEDEAVKTYREIYGTDKL